MKRLAALVACFAALPALADFTATTINDKDGKPRTALYVSSGKVRSESFTGADAGYMLWQVGSKQMTMVMPGKKSYMVMDAAQLAKQMEQVNAQMKQMEAQLASLPPEMREMMKKSVPNMGTGKPLIEIKVSSLNKSDNKGGHACKLWDVTVTGVPMMGPMGQVHCVVPGAEIGVSSADIDTIKAMAEFVKQLTKDMGQFVGGVPDMYQMGGWPVWTKEKSTGESYTLKAIDKSAIAASMFQVPAGFKQQEMPTIGGKPGR